jgi:hypothetical protein
MALVGALTLLLALSISAGASVSHVYSKSYGSATSTPPAPYPVSAPSDVAVDQATGDVYVTDPPNHRVQKFAADGTFILMFGKEVNQTTGGNICTAVSGNVCKAGTSAGSLGGFENPAYLAVDNYAGGNGDVYVGDTGNERVQKFHSSGALVTTWGVNGQKDGSDAEDLPLFWELEGLAIGGRCAQPEHPRQIEHPKNGNCVPDGTLYVLGRWTYGSYNTWLYTQDGEYIKWGVAKGPGGIQVDPEGTYYNPGNFYGSSGELPIWKFIPDQGAYQDVHSYEMATDRPTIDFAFDPSSNELYQVTGPRTEEETHPSRVDRYSDECDPPDTRPCDPLNFFGEAQLDDPRGIAVDGGSHTVYVANAGSDAILVFGDARPIVTTGPATEVSDTSVTLTGSIDPAGRGDVTECFFEYGFEDTYGETVPCSPDPASSPPGSNFSAPTEVTATVEGFSPGTSRHYRLVAVSTADAKGLGEDRTFRTTAPPAVTALASANLTPTTADLVAKINPNGRDTTYRFEYGPTVTYGQVLPVPNGQLAAGFDSESVQVHLEGVTPHVVYHYRLVAENDSGVTTVEDHTFNFYPPACPNSNVRQQTQANFLPDCRAYELVSPGNAGGTQLFPNGPNTGYATAPARLAFTGLFSTIPGSGGSPSDTSGDLYVATRSSTGWSTRFVGWPSYEAPLSGGPPMGPPGSTPGPQREGGSLEANGSGGGIARLQIGVLTDLSMNRFLSFKDGPQSNADELNRTPIASNAPKVFAADGTYLERWPSNLPTAPDGEYPDFPDESYLFPHSGLPFPGEEPSELAPGGLRALDCPVAFRERGGSQPDFYNNFCPGDVTASDNLRHFVFASAWNVFAPGGQLSGPGSVYDNDTQTGEVIVASRTAAGDNIQAEPGNESEDPLQLPAVSQDGSHILMAAGALGPCGFAMCPLPYCGGEVAVKRCQMQPSHLYMRVDGAVTYDVSQGHAVDFVGMDQDGSKVYFLTEEALTSDDRDSSRDLYLWSEQSGSIELVSKADNPGAAGEPGNSDDCTSDFATTQNLPNTKCGVTTYTQLYFCVLPGGGNCISDNSIAAVSGDIYFFSPEQLEGTRGIPNQQNLYLFRNGKVQFVTTLTGPRDCFIPGLGTEFCQRLLRMQVSPDGQTMTFVSSSPVTQYDNDNYKEMYRFRPDEREIVCVSCLPSGEKPTSDVEASNSGLFMSNDGRAFFSTEDPLVHTDTNDAQDVYEYVNGRPQLITLGTGDTRAPKGSLLSSINGRPGLVGVSADGTDVFFGAYDTLVPQDHNGLFLKFYDARSGGGFSAPAPPPPCAAADECHAPGTTPPPALTNGTGISLGDGGNATTKKRKKAKSRNRAKRRHHKGGQGR